MRLSSEDLQHLLAAKGWLELGNYLEANSELDEIAHPLQVHPDVLEARWKVYAMGKKWDGCLAIAETLTLQLPGREQGWLLLAATLHVMGKPGEAYQTLSTQTVNFPDSAGVWYQSAAYACACGDLERGKEFLEHAFEVGGNEAKLKALDDPALKQLWEPQG